MYVCVCVCSFQAIDRNNYLKPAHLTLELVNRLRKVRIDLVGRGIEK